MSTKRSALAIVKLPGTSCWRTRIVLNGRLIFDRSSFGESRRDVVRSLVHVLPLEHVGLLAGLSS